MSVKEGHIFTRVRTVRKNKDGENVNCWTHCLVTSRGVEHSPFNWLTIRLTPNVWRAQGDHRLSSQTFIY